MRGGAAGAAESITRSKTQNCAQKTEFDRWLHTTVRAWPLNEAVFLLSLEPVCAGGAAYSSPVLLHEIPALLARCCCLAAGCHCPNQPRRTDGCPPFGPQCGPAPNPKCPARRAATRTTADPDVSAFLNETVDVATLRADELPDLYGHFIDRVRAERRQWQAPDWNRAAAVLARLNGRYEEVRKDVSLDDRLASAPGRASFIP